VFLITIILSLASADRAEGVSPAVVVRDSSFYKPLVREVAIKAPPAKESELAWGTLKEVSKPNDILMEGNVSFKQEGY